MSVEVGFAGKGDLAAIVEMLRDDRLGGYRESGDIAEYEDAFDQISRDANAYLIVGRQGDEVVSTLQLNLLANISLRATKRAQIEGVRVRASHRGQGIGREMVLWAIDLAKAQGCGMVQLTSDQQRDRAVAFYESLGFRNTHYGLKLTLDDP